MAPSSSNALDERLDELRQHVTSTTSPLSVDALLDALLSVYSESEKLDRSRLPHLDAFVKKYAPTVEKLRASRLSMNDFKVVKLLGRGAFGEVNLCQCKLNNEYYAVKKLKKSEMIGRQEAFFMEERELLGLAQGTWITRLEYAFQDSEYLYLVMEYLAGGNVLSLLYREEVFNLEYARFYLAETVLGIREIHELGFVYRDLKPDNMMLDRHGHIKLADFGSAIRVDENGFVPSNVPVGTPYYIAPEVLMAQDGRDRYGFESDWWSLGIVLYEVMVGEPPFYHDSMLKTYGMIMNHKQHLKFPDDSGLTPEAISLIKGLVCDKKERLTYEGIRAHPFFAGIDWESLRSRTPPFVPELKGPDDTSNFDDDIDEEAPPSTSTRRNDRSSEFCGEELTFVGYTFSRKGIFSGDAAAGDKDAAVPAAATPISRRASDVNRSTELEFKKYREDAERWQTMHAQAMQKVQQVEALRDQLAKNLEKSDRELQAATAASAAAQAKADELEKKKKAVELELEETQRRMTSEARAKADLNARIKELEAQLDQQKKDREQLLASTRDARADTQDLERKISELQEQLEERSRQATVREASVVELTAAKRTLDVQLSVANERLEKEKERRAAAEAEVADLKASLASMTAKHDDATSSSQRLTQELASLQSQLSAAKEALEAEAASRSAAVRAKNETENKRALLEVEVTRLTEQLKVAEQKRKTASEKVAELESALQSKESSQAELRSPGELESLKAELLDERALLARVNEQVDTLNKDKAALVLQVSELKATLDEQHSKQDAANRKIADLQALVDLKSASEKDADAQRKQLEERIKRLQSELDAASAAAARDKAEAARLEDSKAELIAKLEAAEARLSSLTHNVGEESATKRKLQDQLDDVKARLAKEKQHASDLQRAVDEASSAQNALRAELDKAKRRLEELEEQAQAQEAELAGLRKDKAMLQLDCSQLEKRLAAETQAKADLEAEMAAHSQEATMNAAQAAELTQQLEVITAERDRLLDTVEKLGTKLTEEQTTARDLQKNVDELKLAVSIKEQQLSQAVKRLEMSVPQQESSLNMKIRKLREENVTLQSRLSSEEKARKQLERQLADLRSQKEKADREIEELRRNLSSSTSLERKASSASTSSSLGVPSVGGGSSSSSASKRTSMMVEAASAGETLVNFLRKTTATVRRQNSVVLQRPSLAAAGLKPTSNDFIITATGFEGNLRIPKEKGVRQGWSKRYVVVRDYRIYIMDKDSKHQSEAVEVADIKGDVFIVKEAPKSGLMHVNPKELPLIFLVYYKQTHTQPARRSSISASRDEIAASSSTIAATVTGTLAPADALPIIAERLDAVNADIAKETKILEGAQTMLKLAKDTQKRLAQLNVESSQKKIADLKKEVARLEALRERAKAGESVEVDAAPAPAAPVAQAVDTAPIMQKIAMIEKDIANEQKMLKATEALVKATSASTKDKAVAQLEASKKRIVALQADLAQWQEKLKQGAAVSTADIDASLHEHLGHKFVVKKFNVPTNCAYCGDLLYQAGNQGYECKACQYVCHSACHTLVSSSCEECQLMRNITPLMFMAPDEADRERWITNLVALREQLSASTEDTTAVTIEVI